MNDLKEQYPYITDEQWGLVELMEADYLDFLTPEDLQAHKDAVLAQEQAEFEAQVQAIKDHLTAVQDTDEAKLIVGGAMALQQFFFSQTGRYIGQDLMHQFVQYEPFRGLRIYTMAYETPEGEHGYNLQFTFTHSSGLKFMKTMAGEGVQPVNTEWELNIDI